MTSGPLDFQSWYTYAEGGSVERPVPGGAPGAMPVKVSRWRVPPGTHSDLDEHPEHELWLVAVGAGELTYGGTRRDIAAGDVVYLAPHTPHRVHNGAATDLEVFSVWWQ